MSLFPSVLSPEQFHRIARDEAQLGPGLRAICAELGITSAARRFADGSLPVYALGEELVLKLYPPPYVVPERDREAAVLEVLDARLPIPTPSPRAVGELEGWGYVLMSRLQGESLAGTWPTVPYTERARLADELGEALAALHEVRDERLAPARVDWRAFVAEQSSSAQARQRARGLDPRWLEQIPEFLAATSLGSPTTDCLLHTEVMREHLLVKQTPQGFRLSGLFDFEPAMLGPAEYDFGAVGLFFSCGDPSLLGRLLRAYGYPAARLDQALAERLLAFKLLHRYSNLPWYLERLPVPAGVRTLSELAQRWWGTE